MDGFKVWLKELRLPFISASVMPVIVATSLAYAEKATFDLHLFLLTLFGVIFLHLGTNVANDYYDHISGNDALNTEYVRPFTGGSRLIQQGLISPGRVLLTSIAFFAAATVVGIFLIASRGTVILVLGVIGILSGFFYTAPPVRFGYKGIGELLIGLNFGVLITCGAYYVQTGTVSASSVIASLPLAMLITAVVIINEFQDAGADARVGKRTLVVRMGKKNSVAILAMVTTTAYIPIIIGVINRHLPALTLIAIVPIILVIKAIATAKRYYNYSRELAPANALITLSHVLTGILFTIGILAG